MREIKIDTRAFDKAARNYLEELLYKFDISPCEEGELELVYAGQVLALKSNCLELKDARAVSFDFVKNIKMFERQNCTVKKEIFAKALGIKSKNDGLKIIDLTCGTGKDSCMMLYLGAEVYAFERDRLVSILLFDALKRARDDLYYGELFRESFNLEFLDPTINHSISFNPDTVYYDPMFEKSKNKARPRKEMVLFREIIDRASNHEAVINFAKNLNPSRFVVKRARKSKPLFDQKVEHTFIGKSTCYDLYKLFSIK